MINKLITVFDTETTGLLPRKGSDLALYPHMAEIYAMQINPDTDEVIKEIGTLIKIPVPMPPKLTKHVHGISDGMLADKPTFVELWRDIAEVFIGSRVVVAANEPYDHGVLFHELIRIGKEFRFPYPPEAFDTIAKAQKITGKRRSNSYLYEIATGQKLEGAHRAKADVEATYEIYKWLKKKGL